MECYERRNNKRRPEEGWHKILKADCDWPRALTREYWGHHLVVASTKGKRRMYDMWADGHYRGAEQNIRIAKKNLERIARCEPDVRSMG